MMKVEANQPGCGAGTSETTQHNKEWARTERNSDNATTHNSFTGCDHRGSTGKGRHGTGQGFRVMELPYPRGSSRAVAGNAGNGLRVVEDGEAPRRAGGERVADTPRRCPGVRGAEYAAGAGGGREVFSALQPGGDPALPGRGR